VHQERQPSPRDMRQCSAQLRLRHHGESVDARIDEKAFEPPHSGGRESLDVTLVIVNHSAPRRPVDAAFAAAPLSRLASAPRH
jgi:hypothetical protein